MRLLIAAAASLAAFSLISVPAVAGECPAGQVAADAMQPGPSAPVGVTDEVIATIDLSDRYGVPGRQLRQRRLVIEPGGVVPWHSHAERPANIYVVRGEITEYRSTCGVPITHRAGDVTAEAGDIAHWWRNNSRRTTVLISSDIVATTSSEGGM